MTTREIINVVTHANVPDGARLVVHDLADWKHVRLTAEDIRNGGGKLFEAQAIEEDMNNHLGDIEVVDGHFFLKLHKELISFRSRALTVGRTAPVRMETIADFKAIFKKLREVAAQEGVTYKEPKDSLRK